MVNAIGPRRMIRLGMGASVFALLGAGQAFAQVSPPCEPTGEDYCIVTNAGTAGTIAVASPAKLVNTGAISGTTGVTVSAAFIPNQPVPTRATIDNRAGGSITGTGGTAIAGGNLGAVINAGTITGDVQNALMYVANGGTVNGNIQLGNGLPQDFSSQTFVQRGATTGVTGTISAGNGIDSYVRSYASTTQVTLGAQALPTTFEIEGIEARGAGTTVTATAASGTVINGLTLMGDGNVVNQATIGLPSLTGAGFPPNASIATPAINYTGVPETSGTVVLLIFDANNPMQGVLPYSIQVGGALNSFVNEGTVEGDIRIATAGFVNSGTINLQSNATGTLIYTGQDKDFLFRNTGTINYVNNGGRTGLGAIEQNELYDGYVNAAVRIYSAVAAGENAVFENSGEIHGGLATRIVADNVSLVNTGYIAGDESSFTAGVSLEVGAAILDNLDPFADEVLTLVDNVSFLNDADGEILDGVRIEAAADNLRFENRGTISGSEMDARAVDIDHYGVEDDNGDAADNSSFTFINSGTLNGDVVLNTNAQTNVVTNSGDVVMPALDGTFPYGFYSETLEVEVETAGASTVDFANSGSIIQGNVGATALSFEIESGAGSTVNIVNTGSIRSDAGSTIADGPTVGMSQGTLLTVPSSAMFVGVEAPDATVRIENRADGVISSTGTLKMQNANGTSQQFDPIVGLHSAAIVTEVTGTVEIVNAGTIQGGPLRVLPQNVLLDEEPELEGRAIGGAITALGTSDDIVRNTETGVIHGGINLGAGNDLISNYGEISGNVLLGSGDDQFIHGIFATLNGLVDGGEGTDTLTFDITGSNGIISDALLDQFINFEIRTLIGSGDIVTTDEVAVTDGGSLELGENSVVGTLGQTAVSGGDGNESVSNAGTVNGNVDLGNGDNQFTNGGTVNGNVVTGTGSDSFVNNGTIDGDVDLAGGDDSYTPGTGTVTGTVDGGDGVDEVVFNLPSPTLTASLLPIAAPGDAYTPLTPASLEGIVNFEIATINGPGTVSGSGDLPVGTVALNAANLIVEAGATFGSTTGSLAITGSASSETVTVNGTLNGSVALGAGADTLQVGPGGVIAGTASGGAGTDALIVATDGTATAPFEMAGGNFTEFESFAHTGGVTAVSGNLSLGTTGAFAVNSGYLFGRAGSVLTGNVGVASGATFGSAGTVNGNVVVASGGTLSPGASPGVMTVNGNVGLNAGSTTLFEFVAAPGQSDQLVINGELNIAPGSTLNMTGDRPLTPGVTYSMITASGGITGTFTTVNKASTVLGFLRYTATELQLLGTFAAPTGVSLQTAASIDYVNSVLIDGTASAGLLAAIPTLLNADGTASAAAFGQLTPEAYASASQLSIEHGLALAKAARAGLAGAPEGADGPFIFGQGLGNWRDLDGNAAVGTSATQSESFGYFGGVGYGSAGASVGVFVGKIDSKQTIQGLGARTDADGIVAGLAGRFSTGGFDLNLLVAYDWSEGETSRAVPGGTARSRYDLKALTLDVSAGYSVPVSTGWALRPEVGITHIATERDSVREGGSAAFGYAIAGNKPGATFIDGSLMLKGGIGEGGLFKPWVQAGVRHQIDGSLITATGGFPGSTGGLTVLGAWREETVATAGAGLEARLGAVSVYGAYLGEFGDGKSHNITLGVRLGF